MNAVVDQAILSESSTPEASNVPMDTRYNCQYHYNDDVFSGSAWTTYRDFKQLLYTSQELINKAIKATVKKNKKFNGFFRVFLSDAFDGDDLCLKFWVKLLGRRNFQTLMSTQCNIIFTRKHAKFDMTFQREAYFCNDTCASILRKYNIKGARPVVDSPAIPMFVTPSSSSVGGSSSGNNSSSSTIIGLNSKKRERPCESLPLSTRPYKQMHNF